VKIRLLWTKSRTRTATRLFFGERTFSLFLGYHQRQFFKLQIYCVANLHSFCLVRSVSMAGAIVTMLMYLLQPVQNGDIVWSFAGYKGLLKRGEGESKFLLTVGQSVEAFLFGMGRIFPALIVLTLAWASGAIMIDVGADRLFSRWIVGG